MFSVCAVKLVGYSHLFLLTNWDECLGRAALRHCSDLFLMSECAFLFHSETESDPSRARENAPSTSSSAISPLVRCSRSLWSCNNTFVYTRRRRLMTAYKMSLLLYSEMFPRRSTDTPGARLSKRLKKILRTLQIYERFKKNLRKS